MLRLVGGFAPLRPAAPLHQRGGGMAIIFLRKTNSDRNNQILERAKCPLSLNRLKSTLFF